ncbi:transmembrane protein 218 isoform X2 [Pipra filicauda]|uniref:Transmembrane protein 218 n=1 Tax=Pipra filicauda TaxID=649802 RepID=A0A7R5KUI9_9PASS|nr:transmembrane protein 218 isoform X2 [Pipra filicauda]
MAGALGVGPGVLALLLLWAMALLLGMALARAGRARVAALPVVLGAAALTAALLLFPREGESPAPASAEEVSPGLSGQAGPGAGGGTPGMCLCPRDGLRGCPEPLEMDPGDVPLSQGWAPGVP